MSTADLFAAGSAAWEAFRGTKGRRFQPYVPADWPAAAAVLATLRGRADSFLELGSGVGVITILAARLGFDAVGIEVEPALVAASEDLARRFAPAATFAEGSFVPDAFTAAVDAFDTDAWTVQEAASAYPDLGRDLADFDLVYAFHWPGLEELFLDLMARHGRRAAWFLTYHGTEGYRIYQDGVEVAP